MPFTFKLHHLATMINQSADDKEVVEWFDALTKILPYYDISTEKRLAAFIAQCGHESNSFIWVEENLNYSADALNKIFAKYFKNAGRDAKDYHRHPEKIANVVYANRMGNGDTDSGDGWKFRGRGLIQLTGKDNYARFAKSLSISINQAIKYITTKEGAVEAACWFWKENNLNDLADDADIIGLTKRINGGTHGITDRISRYEHACEVLGVAIEPIQPLVPIQPQSTVTVRRGDRNETVKLVQEAIGITADGIFGIGTEKAVKKWQSANGLTSDGIVGPKTLTKMIGRA